MHHGAVSKLLLLFRQKIRHHNRKINGIVGDLDVRSPVVYWGDEDSPVT